MALSKEIVVSKIEVLEKGQIQARIETRILEDGEILSRSFHRHVLNPGDNLANEDSRVSNIAQTVWTPDVISAYQTMIANQV